MRYEIRSRQTIDNINDLLDNGIKRISVLIRHSDRFFSGDSKTEAFMGLTEKGKDFAVDFGRSLRKNPFPRLYSSCFGRCIETAYLIDKGFAQKNKVILKNNEIDENLSTFYIRDLKKVVSQLGKEGNEVFLRKWFDKLIDEDIIQNPEKTSDILSRFMIEKLNQIGENEIGICVSHDWNIFPLKKFKLGLKYEDSGNIGYLEGIIFFKKGDQVYITNYQTEPKPV